MTVYVVDAWNGTTQRSVVVVCRTLAKAKRELERVTRANGDWYAGIVKRNVR